MRITCPQCGFFRELPDNKVPVTSTMATCPKCRHRFKFRPDTIAPRERDFRGLDLRGEVLPPPAATVEGPSSWRRPGPAAAAARELNPPEEAREPAPAPETPPLADPSARPDPKDAAADVPTTVTPPPRRIPASRLVQEPFPPAETSAPAETPAPAETAVPAQPVPDREPAAAGPTPVAAAPEAREPEPTPEPAVAPEQPAASAPSEAQAKPGRGKRGLDKDGVRDIWARLQALDGRADQRAKEKSSEEEPEPPVTDPIPWERQESYGFFPALFLTLRRILFQPADFFASMPEGRPKGRALVFNLLISEFLFVIDFLWTLVGLRAGGHNELAGALPASQGLSFLVVLLLVPPALTCGIYLDAWITHLLLLLFRNAHKSFAETFRVLCYSAAPTVLSAVPVAGQILSPLILVWYMALQAMGLKKIHQGAYTQVLAAVFIKWSLYLFLLLAMLQSFAPGR